MSRTKRKEPYGSPWGQESPTVKRLFRRQFRARCKAALRRGRHDRMPRWRGTCGWLTW